MPDSPEPSRSVFRLGTVQVGAVRSLLEVGPLPVQPGMTLIAGRNDGGKTSLFDALNMLLNNVRIPAEARTTGATAAQPTYVMGEFGEDQAEATIRLRTRIADSGAVIREIEDRVHAGLDGAPEDMPLPKLRERMTALAITSPGGSAKAPYVESARQWLATRPVSEFQLRWRALSTPEAALLPRFSMFRSQEAVDPASQIQRLIAREARSIMAESYAPTLEPLSQELNADIAPSLEKIKDSILQYCPSIDSVDVTADFDFSRTAPVVTFVVRRGSEDILFEQLGDGQRQRITLALHRNELRALQEEGDGHPEIIAYDEPDTHLGYSSQRDLFDILSAQADIPHVQVLVATHSSNFIDERWLEADFAELREDSQTSFSNALLALFRERCRRFVGKPELGEALARQIDNEEVPAAVKDCLTALRRMTN